MNNSDWALETNSQQSSGEWELESPGQQQEEQQEGLLSKAARYPMQVVKAAPYLSPVFGIADLTSSVQAGGAVQETLNDLEDLYSRGLLTEKEYNESVQKVSSQHPEEIAPTLHNLYSLVEKRTGLPLEAKNWFQKFTEIGATAAASYAGGSVPQRMVAMLSVPTAREGLIAAGTPEPVANIISALFMDPIALSKTLKDLASKPFQAAVRPAAKTAEKVISAAERFVPEAPAEPRAIGTVSKISSKPISEISEQVSLATKGLAEEELAARELQKTQLISDAEKRARAEMEAEARNIRPVPKEPELIIEQPTSKPTSEVEIQVGERKPIHEKVSDIFTKEDVKNSTEGGRRLKTEVSEIADKKYKEVNAAYEDAKYFMDEPVEDDIGLKEWAANARRELGPSKLDNSAEASLRKWLKLISKKTFKTNQEKINLIQKINSFVDYSMPHGSDAKKIFEPLKKQLNLSVERTASDASLEAWQGAKAKYAQWQKDFANPTISKLRDIENVEYKNLFESVQDHDSFAAVQRVFSLDPSKAETLQILKKNLVRRQLDPYVKNPRRIGELAYHEELNELVPYLSENERGAVSKAFEEERYATAGIEAERASVIEKERAARAEHSYNLQRKRALRNEEKAKIREIKQANVEAKKKIKARNAELEAEKKEIAKKFSKQDQVVLNSKEIEARMDRVDSAREVQKVVEKTKNGKELYQELVRRKASEKLFGNKPVNSKDLAKGLKDIETRRWLVEMMGQEEVTALEGLSSEWTSFDNYIEKYGDPKKYPWIYDAFKESGFSGFKALNKFVLQNILHPQRIRNVLKTIKKPISAAAKSQNLPGPSAAKNQVNQSP